MGFHVDFANKLPRATDAETEVPEKVLLVLLFTTFSHNNHNTEWRISKAEPRRN